MFYLNDQEIDFCLFLLIVSRWKDTENYFIDHRHCDVLGGRKYLATLLNKSLMDLGAISSGTLSRIGLLEMDRYSMVIQEDYLEFLHHQNYPKGRSS